jgi:hypothetical protein
MQVFKVLVGDVEALDGGGDGDVDGAGDLAGIEELVGFTDVFVFTWSVTEILIHIV